MDTTIPRNVMVWVFGGKPGNLRSQNKYSTGNSGDGYSLHCQSNNQYLTYAKQELGINIGYTKRASEHKIHFRLPDGAERDILSGESAEPEPIFVGKVFNAAVRWRAASQKGQPEDSSRRKDESDTLRVGSIVALCEL